MEWRKTSNLRIVNAAFAYDTPNGETVILIFNQAIYAGSQMEDSLVNPIQCLLNDVKIDTRPKLFYPEEDSAQSIQFDDQLIGLKYNGPLPYFDVRRPSQEEFQTCQHYDMTQKDGWNLEDLSCNISELIANVKGLSPRNEINIHHDIYGIA